MPKNGAIPTAVKDLTYNKVTDIPGPVTIAAQYDGGMTTDPATKATMFATRVVAVGAAKFLQNDTQDPVTANFFTNSVDWLVKKNAVLDIAPKKPQQYGVSLSPISYRTVVCVPASSSRAQPWYSASPPGSRAASNTLYRYVSKSSTYIYLAIAVGVVLLPHVRRQEIARNEGH